MIFAALFYDSCAFPKRYLKASYDSYIVGVRKGRGESAGGFACDVDSSLQPSSQV